MRSRMALAAVLVLTVAARADDTPKLTTAPMPTVVYATASEKNSKVTVKWAQMVTNAVQEKVKVKEGDQEVERVVTKVVFVPVEQQVEIDGKTAKAVRVNGKDIDAKELPKLLEKATPVLIVTHGPLDAYYKPVYKDDTIVILTNQPPPPPK